jgi:hypothetical protein
MSAHRNPNISRRKQPKQARSAQLIDIAPQAAVQVWRSSGVRRFGAARVVDLAGDSTGGPP